jgi:hypothetical protein
MMALLGCAEGDPNYPGNLVALIENAFMQTLEIEGALPPDLRN